jgi:hypothetical protein
LPARRHGPIPSVMIRAFCEQTCTHLPQPMQRSVMTSA